MSEFVSVGAKPNHEIVHALRPGEANRTADEPLDPGPQIDMLALGISMDYYPYVAKLTQRHLWAEKSVDDISEAAMERHRASPNKGMEPRR